MTGIKGRLAPRRRLVTVNFKRQDGILNSSRQLSHFRITGHGLISVVISGRRLSFCDSGTQIGAKFDFSTDKASKNASIDCS